MGGLERGEAHVWTVDPATLSEAEEAELSEGVLCAAERARMQRLHFARDRQLFVAAHALLRFALSGCAPAVPPAAWTFTTTRHGRPELVPPHDGLRFNLSHSKDLVACVVVRHVDCGVDVERTEGTDVALLSSSVLAPSERRSLAVVPPTDRPALFFRYWTLKEAYVKARGLGLSLEFDRCVFALDGQRAVLVSAPDHPRAEDWQFAQWAPTPSHTLAIALHAGPAGRLRIVRHPGQPDWHFPAHPSGARIEPETPTL